MKIRTGFVSNSSSSSFVIAVKKPTGPCQHCGRSDPDFLALVDGEDEAYVATEGVVDVLAYVEDLDDMPALTKQDPSTLAPWEQHLLACYNRLKNDDWTDYQVVRVRLDDHNQTLYRVLKQQAAAGTIEILESDY